MNLKKLDILVGLVGGGCPGSLCGQTYVVVAAWYGPRNGKWSGVNGEGGQGLWVSGEAFEEAGQDTLRRALGDWIITESVSKETIS